MNRLTPTPFSHRLLRTTGDLTAAVVAFFLAFFVRIELRVPFTQFLLPAERIRFFYREWWIIALAQLLTLYFFGFYDPPRGSVGTEQVRRLLAATSLEGVMLAGFYFLTDREFPRSVLLLFVAFNFLLLWLFRWAVETSYRPPLRRVVLVGCGAAARELAGKIASQGSQSIEVAGHVPAPDEPLEGLSAPPPALGPCLGTVEDLPALLSSGKIDDLILAGSARPWQTRLLDRLASEGEATGNVLLLPGPIESLIGRMRYRWVDDLPLIEVVRQSEWRINRPLKRWMDLVGATALSLLTLPLLLLGMVVVKASSAGPVFFRQERVGLG
ncbi:MAG TPA: sugar transferase, partial [Thermoanaerobaculia bacterium]|nr:sugar transferase [Thermoanaerobaculia bacterium]